MTFDEMLDQAIEMLQRRGRLTYGALKRQFQIDDAYLEDLKDELIYGQQLARDEDGRVIVWVGQSPVVPPSTIPTFPYPSLGEHLIKGRGPAQVYQTTGRLVGRTCMGAIPFTHLGESEASRILRITTGKPRAIDVVSCQLSRSG